MNVNRSKTLSINVEKCSNHEFLLLQLEKDHSERNLTQKLSRGLTASGDVRTKCVESYCELADQKGRAVVHISNALFG